MICPNCKAVDGWGAACYVCRPGMFTDYNYFVGCLRRWRGEPMEPELPDCMYSGCSEEATESGRCVRHEAVYQVLTETR